MKIKIIIMLLISFALSEFDSIGSSDLSMDLSYESSEDYFIDPDTYIVGPGDVFDFRMNTSHKIVSNRLKVSPIGDVIIPIIGQINVNNMILSSAFELIRSECKNKIENATVDITLYKIKTFKVLVLGPRGVPTGYYYVNSATTLLNLFNQINSKFKNELEAISSRNITMISDGLEKKYDLIQYQYDGDSMNNPFLLPGNVVKLKYIQDQIIINGAIMVPGSYEYKSNESLLNLIEISGGYKNNADLQNIELTRYTNDIDKEIIYLKEDMFSSFILKPSDQILIKPKKDYKRKINVSIKGEVANPGIYSIDDSATIKDIILRSGGYSMYADSSKIKLNNKAIENLPDRELKRILAINYENQSDEDRAYVKARSHVEKGEFISSRFDFEGLLANYKLFNDDEIYIPHKYDFIEIIGAVKNPGRYPFNDSFTFSDYIEQAGGLSKRSAKKYFIIDSSTGEKKPIKLSSKKKDISSQDIIFVQSKNDFNSWERFQDGIALTSRVLTIMAILNSL